MSNKTWNIDTSHSNVGFVVRHMVIARVRGNFGDWTGALQFDPANPESASVETTIQIASIDTGVQDRDAHLRSPDFFDAEQYPTMRFVSTKVTKGSGDELLIAGELTIRDVTREVILNAEFSGTAKDPWGNERVAFTAKTAIDRRDFGLTWNQALETGGVLVGERINIELEIEAVAAS